MSFISALMKQFHRPLTAHIDFEDTQFYIATYKGSKPYPVQKAIASTCLSAYIAAPNRVGDVTRIEITWEQAKRLYQADGDILTGKGISLSFSQAAAEITFREYRYEWPIHFSFDKKAGILRRHIPESILALAPYYYLQGNVIWYFPFAAEWEIIGKDTFAGNEILEIIAAAGELNFRCDLGLGGTGVAIQTGEISNNELTIILREKVPRAEWIPLKGLPNRIVHDGYIYEILPPAIEKSLFPNAAKRLLSGQIIPRFATQYEDIWRRFGDEEVRQRFLPENCILQDKNISLILECRPQHELPLKKPVAVPMLCCDEQAFPAKEISIHLRDGFAPVGARWVEEASLNTVGIGALGRKTDGSALDTVPIFPHEILRRGSERLNAHWNGLSVDIQRWKPSGNPEEIFAAHLAFLCGYGINGGVVIPPAIQARLFLNFLDISRDMFGNPRVLVIMQRAFYNACMESDAFQAQAALCSVVKTIKDGAKLKDDFQGTAICFYPQLDKLGILSSMAWDIVWMAEPDLVYKTDRSSVYQATKQIRSGLWLGMFSTTYHELPSMQTKVMRSILQLDEQVDEGGLAQYIIRDATRSLDLPKPYQFSNRLKVPVDNHLKSRTISLGYGTQLSVTIQEKPWQSRTRWRETAQRYTKRAAKPAKYVKYHSSKPSYSNMSRRQRRWYLYWRAQVREGNYLKTDPCYIILYASEIINGLGWASPQEGCRQLISLLNGYGEVYSNQKKQLVHWIFDYILLHSDCLTLKDILDDPLFLISEVCFNLHLYSRHAQGGELLDCGEIQRLGTYRMDKSKFAQAGFGPLLEQNVTDMVHQIDERLRFLSGKNLLQSYHPHHFTTVTRDFFAGAVVLFKNDWTMDYPDYLHHEPLNDFIDGIMKHTENCLRAQENFPGRLRGISLDEYWTKFIDAQIKNASGLNVAGRIILEEDRMDQLRNDSAKVRELLHIEIDETPALALRANDAPSSSLADVQAIYRSCDDVQRELIAHLSACHWEASQQQLERLLPNQMISHTVDEINQIAIVQSGVLAITFESGYYRVNDDFQDSLQFILAHDTSEVLGETDLNKFLRSLTQEELAALRGLASDNEEMRSGVFHELLYDQINEKFEHWVGDLLIDSLRVPPEIAEEYQEELSLLLK